MTLVDTETGEILQRSALAIPRPEQIVDVYDWCQRAESMLNEIDDVGEIATAKAGFAAIDAYLAQTTKDGRGRVAATIRRLEARIGELIGESEHGGDRKSDQVRRDGLDLALSKHERSEFRLMAAHKDVVEAVIADCDDAAPPSRKKVLTAIRVQQQTNTPKEQDVIDTSNKAVDDRIYTAREMAAQGFTSRQIAAAIGISNMGDFKKRHGIHVPADAVTGKTSLPDPNRIVRETVLTLESVTTGLVGLVKRSELDQTELAGWCQSLSESIQTLRKFLKELM